MAKTISILGCGWLGVPLAIKLIASGFKIKGSVTTPEKLGSLQQAGIWPYLLEIYEDDIKVDDERFFDTDVVIVSLPPKRIPNIEVVFPAQISQLISMLEKHKVKNVLFISSTSVYAENGKTVTENDFLYPEKPSGKALVLAEMILIGNPNFKTTVLRFGGLIGADRNPARFMGRKTKPVFGSVPVNLIHRDDCIDIITEIIRQNNWGEVYNACCPVHPTKQEFYGKVAEVSGSRTPEFSDGYQGFKIVESKKLMKNLDYKFKYPSPLDCLDEFRV